MTYARTCSLLLSIAAVVALPSCGGSTSSPTVAASTAVTKEAKGVVITLNGVELTRDIKPAGFIKDAPAGAIYVVASYRLKNTAAEPLSFENWPQPRLVDPAGHALEPDLGASTFLSAAGNAIWAENVNPNLTTDAKLVWKVDDKAFDRKTWTLGFDVKPKLTFALQ